MICNCCQRKRRIFESKRKWDVIYENQKEIYVCPECFAVMNNQFVTPISKIIFNLWSNYFSSQENRDPSILFKSSINEINELFDLIREFSRTYKISEDAIFERAQRRISGNSNQAISVDIFVTTILKPKFKGKPVIPIDSVTIY